MGRHDQLEPVAGVRLDFLREMGFGELAHDSHVPFLSHLAATRNVLAHWGCSQELCDAGLFHSVYGTGYFDIETDASRPAVRRVIGVHAERLVWLWCNIERDSIDTTTQTATNRRDGSPIDLAADELGEIATLWAADTVEQIERMDTDERDFADGLPRILHLACPDARQATDQILHLIDGP